MVEHGKKEGGKRVKIYLICFLLCMVIILFKGIVKWEICFFVKSWAIVPRGTSNKKIGLEHRGFNFIYVTAVS